ncbi:hypothetical protein CB1_000293028 [Camelus ferus]|nr:hypothetical protein CB1_000293028 [Camelus ferus]
MEQKAFGAGGNTLCGNGEVGKQRLKPPPPLCGNGEVGKVVKRKQEQKAMAGPGPGSLLSSHSKWQNKLPGGGEASPMDKGAECGQGELTARLRYTGRRWGPQTRAGLPPGGDKSERNRTLVPAAYYADTKRRNGDVEGDSEHSGETGLRKRRSGCVSDWKRRCLKPISHGPEICHNAREQDVATSGDGWDGMWWRKKSLEMRRP